jgi:hypothetical protein
LYALDDARRVLRGDIHHPPWRLQPADVDIDRNTMAAQLAIELDGDPLLHYPRSLGADVRGFDRRAAC